MSFYGKDYPDPVEIDPTMPAPDSPAAPVAPVSLGGSGETGAPETGLLLDEVRAWLARFIITLHEDDLDLLTLWAAHTWLAFECYTTPRLVLDSPVPGSGKTTVLEHFERLCQRPVQMASLSSPALLTRMLDDEMRTILIDEADRSLNPKKEGVGELLAVLNSGYKRGATRPVLVPTKESGWATRMMPTFAPVVMAGNNPTLPDDTQSRSLRVLLMPDIDGAAEESDWEVLDPDARQLGSRLKKWAAQVRGQVRSNRPDLPAGIRGRMREKWGPLKRVAVAAGGRWPDVVDALAVHDLQQMELDREDGMTTQAPHVALLAHLHECWPPGKTFAPTGDILSSLVREHPEMWGDGSPFGKALTAQRLGRMLARAYRVNSTRLDRGGPRGYTYPSLTRAWRRMGVTTNAPVPATPQKETGATGAAGETGAMTETLAPPDDDLDDTACRACNFPLPPDRLDVGYHRACLETAS